MGDNGPHLRGAWRLGVAMLAASCSTGPDIIRDFGFDVETLPYCTEVRAGERVPLHFRISREGAWSGESYSLRFFRSHGSGWLADTEGNRITENMTYRLPDLTFGMAYVTVGEGSEQFAVWISNSFGRETQMQFTIEVTR